MVEHFTYIWAFDHFQIQTFGVAEVDEELVASHLDDEVLNLGLFTCLSSVFSLILMKVPELLPQSLI